MAASPLRTKGVPAPAAIAAMYINTFTGNGCRGNSHAVVVARPSSDDVHWQRLSNTTAPVILVVVTPMQRGYAAARFFHYGQSVTWCGSGILAAADALRRGAAPVNTITTTHGSFEVVTKNGRLGFASHHHTRWRPACQTAFWRARFGSAFEQALQTPEAVGYTLVELNSAQAVKNWVPHFRSLSRHSRRALILTAKGSDSGGPDYVMRYFAPQYGNNEDAATGSANALLISFWAQKLKQHCVCGRQLSAEGGLFYGQSLGRRGAALYGKTELVGSGTLPLDDCG